MPRRPTLLISSAENRGSTSSVLVLLTHAMYASACRHDSAASGDRAARAARVRRKKRDAGADDALPRQQHGALHVVDLPARAADRRSQRRRDPAYASIRRRPCCSRSIRARTCTSKSLLAADAPLTALTLECWVRLFRLDTWQTLIAQYDYPQACGFALGVAPEGRIEFYLGDGEAYRREQAHPGPQLEVRRWYHVVGTWDGQTKTLWIDGQSVGQWP